MDLTNGSLRKQMITFAIPLILTSVFKQSLSFVDTLIVARFCNPESLSAISLASSLYSFLASFVNGFGLGCSVVIGKVYGTKQDQATKDASYTLVLLGSGLSFLLALSCFLTAPYYIQWIQPPAQITDTTRRILWLYTFDLFFYGLSLVASCLLNGLGDSRNPFRISTISSLLNVILDLIAAAVFRAGVIGCVITTLLSQAVGAICLMICLVRKMRRISTRFSLRTSVIRETFTIGSTSIAQESLFNVLAILAQSVVAPYGVDCINGYSIGRQLFSIFSTAINGYNRAYSTALSHNYGAKQFDRINAAKRLTLIDGNILCLLLATLSISLGRPLISIIFTEASHQTVVYAMTYLTLSLPVYFISFHTQRTTSMLRVYKQNKKILASSAITMLVKAVCLYPAAAVSVYLLPVADIISKATAFLYLKTAEKKTDIHRAEP